DDKDAIEAIWTDFQSLSSEDQATLDAESHPNTDQSLGRVLETALWAVRSFDIDDSTTLADGTYTTTSNPAVSSESNKGKSTSSRVRNWWVDRVDVADGHAIAHIYVTSGDAAAKKLTSYPSVWVGGETIPREADDTYPIPIDLNGLTYFGGISSSMPYPIMYELKTTIDEPEIPDAGVIDLEVTNSAEGLSADQASVEVASDNSAELTVDLEGESAGYLYAGTLGQAIAASADLTEWIAGEAQENGTMRFIVPIAVNATAIPFAVVGSDDVDDIAENLHPYMFELDLSAATLALERYDNTFDVNVEVADGIAPELSCAQTASVRAIGDPNDSMFKCVVTLGMNDGAYDYIEYESMIEGEIAPAGASISDGSFLLVFENSAGKKSFSLGEPIAISIHHVDSDLWLDRTLTLDLAQGVIRIDGTDDSEDVVKALIEALPSDPIAIRDDSDGAVAKATAAFEALPSDVQARLNDVEKPPLNTITYGRVLENSQWAVDAMTHADSSTSLPEGVYTTGITSSYDYGKSQSSRSKAFNVKSITVKDGVAIATIEHESTTDGIMHINGREYANNPPVNNKDYRTYDVPIDLNSTMHLVWKAQDAGSGTTGISVELTNAIDESRTSPDSPLPSGDDGTSSEEYEQVINELLDIIDKLQSSGVSGTTVNPNASTASNSSALAAAAAARTGNTSKASTTGAASSPTAQASLGKNSLGTDSLGNLTYSSTSNEDAGNAPLAILAGILCAAALGALGFALRFVHREDKN
ncbi:MAG: hypothetical protein Q4D34_05945, partial [Eggerthellaceae bacterium]|nr:hypothetical protein [Eggerthellaceae bacterium]